MPANLLVDLLGWIGALALLAAYALVSRGRVTGQSVPYQVLNVVGSVLLVANTLYYGAYPSTFVNFVWVAIAAVTLLRVRSAAARRDGRPRET
jgi:hypothetical protein